MGNTIQVKRKITTGAPDPALLAVGEHCYVLSDKKMYIKNLDGSITLLNLAITSGTAAPAGGSDGDIYLQYTN